MGMFNLTICGGSISYRDMACHTWALSGNKGSAARIHRSYEDQMNKFGLHFDYGHNLRGETLVHIRQWCIESLRGLCDKRTRLKANEVYLCGGFREGQVCPEHLWLEDHTANRTYDTFIAQRIAIINRIGNQNAPFQPGCEGRAFAANEIARTRVDGFTAGQCESIRAYSENR